MNTARREAHNRSTGISSQPILNSIPKLSMAEDTSIGLVISTPQPLSTPSLRTTESDRLSPLERLRQRRHDRWLEALRHQLAGVLVAFPCRVWLFGSRARGDWDGFSDTDLLVVAESAERAERAADRLSSAGVGDDVLSLDEGRWQAMADSFSPHWRAVRAQARCIHPTP